MAVHFKPEETKRYLSPEDLGLTYGSAMRMDVTDEISIESGERELCLVCISGEDSYECKGEMGMAVLGVMLFVPMG